MTITSVHFAQCDQIIRLATAVNDPIVLFTAYVNRILGSIMIGNRVTLDADLDTAEAVAAQPRQAEPRVRSCCG